MTTLRGFILAASMVLDPVWMDAKMRSRFLGRARIALATLFLLVGSYVCANGHVASSDHDSNTSIARFLDSEGYLHRPAGFKGTIDPRGYEFVSGAGEAPRFIKTPGDGRWLTFGGIQNGCNGEVHSLAFLPNGNVVVAGYFSLCVDTPVHNIAIWDGVTWTSLGTGIDNEFDGPIYAVAVIGNDLYAGGPFTQVGSTAANGIARWNGSTWSSLGAGKNNGLDNTVFALATIGSDLYIGGAFQTAGGGPARGIARWDGSAWSSLGQDVDNGVDGTVLALAADSANVYVGGTFAHAGEASAQAVAIWDGSGWSALGASGNGVDGDVRSLLIVGTDLYIGGEFSQAGNVPANCIARWDGAEWHALGDGVANAVDGGCSVLSMTVIGSDLYAGGSFTEADGNGANYVARWDGDSWTPVGSGSANGVNGYQTAALLTDGTRLFVGGPFTLAGGAPANDVAIWDGSNWSAMGSGSGDGLSRLVQAVAAVGGDTYVGGYFAQAGSEAANHIARWDGSQWSSLGTGAENGVDGSVSAIASLGSDIYVGGQFTHAGTVQANGIARWDGSAWHPLASGLQQTTGAGRAYALVTHNQSLYVGGAFVSAGGIEANHLARWDGTGWASIGSGQQNGVDQSVQSMAFVDDNLYVGGAFTLAGSIPANHVARWNGAEWGALGVGATNGVTGPGSDVYALATLGTELFVGGDFDHAGGIAADNICAWNGNEWTRLGGPSANGTNSPVAAIVAFGSDIYVGGGFSEAGNSPAHFVAKWDGSSWSSLGGDALDSSVFALSVVADGVWIGGAFSRVSEDNSSFVAVWEPIVDRIFVDGFEG